MAILFDLFVTTMIVGLLLPTSVRVRPDEEPLLDMQDLINIYGVEL